MKRNNLLFYWNNLILYFIAIPLNNGLMSVADRWWHFLILKKKKLEKTETHYWLSWIISNNDGLGWFSVGFPSTKWLEHILDSSNSWKFSLLLTNVGHHLRFAVSFGNLCNQNLSKRLYPQFVWAAPIIITYSNEASVFSNHIYLFPSQCLFQ